MCLVFLYILQYVLYIFTDIGRYFASDYVLIVMLNIILIVFLLKFRLNNLIKNFIGPMIIGLFIGKVFYDLWSYYNNDMFLLPLRGLSTFSENYTIVLEYVSKFMILVFVASGINMIKDNGVKFIKRYFSLLLVSTLVLALVTSFIGYFLISAFISPINNDSTIYIDPFKSLLLAPIEIMDSFSAFCIGVIVGMLSSKDSYTMKLIHEGETLIIKFMLKVMLPLMSIWIMASFSKNGFENSSSKIILIDLYLSLIILAIQFGWLYVMYFISYIKSGVSFKSLFKSGMRLYMKVVSLAGNSTGIIVSLAIQEQSDLGFSKDKAKFISSTSFNMPGSLISNIIFAQGVIYMFDIDVSIIMFLFYIVTLVFGLIIAPSVPGSVFAFTSGFLNPILGFSPDQVNVMGGLYFKQGTSNSAVNNASDIYVAALLDGEENLQ